MSNSLTWKNIADENAILSKMKLKMSVFDRQKIRLVFLQKFNRLSDVQCRCTNNVLMPKTKRFPLMQLSENTKTSYLSRIFSSRVDIVKLKNEMNKQHTY